MREVLLGDVQKDILIDAWIDPEVIIVPAFHCETEHIIINYFFQALGSSLQDSVGAGALADIKDILMQKPVAPS
jgi:hypothetical protein